MHQIIVIGTEPPCPRCALLTSVFKELIARFNLDASVKHINYSDTAAVEFAADMGLITGTAKDVAVSLGIKLDLRRVKNLIEHAIQDQQCEFNEFNDCKWSRELDEFLKPFEQKAWQKGILMTPVVIINGQLKHNGSVPAMKNIRSWLKV